MLLIITLIGLAMIVLAAAEIWLFWSLGERDDRRRRREHPNAQGPNAGTRRAGICSPRKRLSTSGRRTSLRSRFI